MEQRVLEGWSQPGGAIRCSSPGRPCHEQRPSGAADVSRGAPTASRGALVKGRGKRVGGGKWGKGLGFHGGQGKLAAICAGIKNVRMSF